MKRVMAIDIYAGDAFRDEFRTTLKKEGLYNEFCVKWFETLFVEG